MVHNGEKKSNYDSVMTRAVMLFDEVHDCSHRERIKTHPFFIYFFG